MRATQAMASQRICAESQEPSLLAGVITKNSCTGLYLEIHIHETIFQSFVVSLSFCLFKSP